MVLSDTYIKQYIDSGHIEVDPYDESNIEPASVDLRLGSDFKKAKTTPAFETTSLSDDDDSILWDEYTDSIVLQPDDFILATTKETIGLSKNIVAHVLGRSSLGRLGVSVHQTAGYIDPGFSGEITLELSNHGPASIELSADDRICQIVFEHVSGPVEEPYGHDRSQYQHQSGATRSGMSFD